MSHVLDAGNCDKKSIKFSLSRPFNNAHRCGKFVKGQHKIMKRIRSLHGGLIQRQRLFDLFLLIEGRACYRTFRQRGETPKEDECIAHEMQQAMPDTNLHCTFCQMDANLRMRHDFAESQATLCCIRARILRPTILPVEKKNARSVASESATLRKSREQNWSHTGKK